VEPRRFEDGERNVMVDEKRKVVIDASVVIKWFVKEKDRERALMLREKHVKGGTLLSAPCLLAYEVCNALRHNPDFIEEDVKKAVKSLFELHIEFAPPTIDNMNLAVENAFRHGITAYDASYLSLAETENCPFVTADEKLYERLKENPLAMLLASNGLREVIG